MPSIHVWYVRRRGEIIGPYPAGLISRYILLGRVRDDDEISADGTEWTPVRDHPELIPSVMKAAADDPLAQQRLEAARRWADERTRERRAEADAGAPPEDHRQRGDRRTSEDPAAVDHRAARAVRAHEQQSVSAHSFALVLIVGVVAVVLGGVAYFHRPPPPSSSSLCSSAPASKVNWSNCVLDGAQLARADLTGAVLYSARLTAANLAGARLAASNASYATLSLASLEDADLRDANLTGANLRRARLVRARLDRADLSYADLTGADLAGATLAGARLGNAIWTDGRICAPGSVGACQPRQ